MQIITSKALTTTLEVMYQYLVYKPAKIMQNKEIKNSVSFQNEEAEIKQISNKTTNSVRVACFNLCEV